MSDRQLNNLQSEKGVPTGAPFFVLPGVARVRSLEEAETHIQSLLARVEELERILNDHAQRHDTAETPFLRRVWFKLDGWPWRDLNADRPAWRPWRRWWTS